MIIGVLCEKGGTGKITIATNLAARMSGDTITAPLKSGCGTLILPHL